MIKIYAAFLFLLAAATLTHAQHPELQRDTVDIFKNKTGVSYKAYLSNWFFGYGYRSSWVMAKENHQDSLVLYGPPRYFKVYDRKHHLLFEGGNKTPAGELEGDVIYYYQGGTKKRTEHWDHRYVKDTCNTSILMNDAPGREGSWLYFRRSGALKKRVTYAIAVTSCEPLTYHTIKTITLYKRNGKSKRPRTRKAKD